MRQARAAAFRPVVSDADGAQPGTYPGRGSNCGNVASTRSSFNQIKDGRRVAMAGPDCPPAVNAAAQGISQGEYSKTVMPTGDANRA